MSRLKIFGKSVVFLSSSGLSPLRTVRENVEVVWRPYMCLPFCTTPRRWIEDHLSTEPALNGKCPHSSCWGQIYWCEWELLSYLGCQGYTAEEQLFLAFVLALFGTVLGMGKGSTWVILRPLLRSQHGFSRSLRSGLFTVVSQILGRQQKAKLNLPQSQQVWNK